MRRIKGSVFSKFKIPVSEVDDNDLWQRTTLGFAVVGNSKQKLNSIIDKVSEHIFNLSEARVVDKKFDFIYMTDDS